MIPGLTLREHVAAYSHYARARAACFLFGHRFKWTGEDMDLVCERCGTEDDYFDGPAPFSGVLPILRDVAENLKGVFKPLRRCHHCGRWMLRPFVPEWKTVFCSRKCDRDYMPF